MRGACLPPQGRRPNRALRQTNCRAPVFAETYAIRSSRPAYYQPSFKSISTFRLVLTSQESDDTGGVQSITKERHGHRQTRSLQHSHSRSRPVAALLHRRAAASRRVSTTVQFSRGVVVPRPGRIGIWRCPSHRYRARISRRLARPLGNWIGGSPRVFGNRLARHAPTIRRTRYSLPHTTRAIAGSNSSVSGRPVRRDDRAELSQR